LAALESGTSPNFSKIAQQVGVSPPTAAEYYNILEDTLIIHRLPRFGRTRNRVVGQTKSYFFDLGVRNCAANIGHSIGIITLQKGVLFEHFVVLEALASFADKARLSYWRDKRNEVDLILEFGDMVVAVEIKATERPTAKHFSGLNAFADSVDVEHSFLVCQAVRAEKFGRHLAISWRDFIDRLDKIVNC